MNTANRNIDRAGHLRHGIDLYRAQQRMYREQEMRLELRDSLPPDELPDMTRDYGPQPGSWVHNPIVLAVMVGIAAGILFARSQGWIS